MSMVLKCLRPYGFCIRMSKRIVCANVTARTRNLKTKTQTSSDESSKMKTRTITSYVLLLSACLLGYHAFIHFATIPSKKVVSKKKKQISKYSAEDVKSHASPESRVWVTSGHSVYDITDYLEAHPGGEIIAMAAGGSLEPFWEKYPVHKKSEMEGILEDYKIGVITVDESKLLVSQTVKKLKQLEDKRTFTLNAKDYKLHIASEVNSDHFLTLNDIKTKFKKRDLKADLKCASIQEMKTEKALWSGAWLTDVLTQPGMTLSDARFKYIHFLGLDEGFSITIPMEVLLTQDPSKVLLAYEMNGQELQSEQGYPVRVIIPTETGFKSVKWLGKIVLSREKCVDSTASHK